MTILEQEIKAGYLTIFPIFTKNNYGSIQPTKTTVMGHIHTLRGSKKIVLLKFLLASNVSEPIPSQKARPCIIEDDKEQVTQIPIEKRAQDNIIQPEPELAPAAPVAPPLNVHQTPQSVQQTNIPEFID